jgi:tryptophan 2,3-dioxygenase
MNEYKGTYYPEYLKLDKFLDAQKPLSNCHDEMLFIIVHQAYEVWFKQILHEVDSIAVIFKKENVSESDLSTCLHRLQRVLKIFQLIPGHFDILETMTPMDFLEFRNVLVPASGFQSVQFRSIEIKLGLKNENRVQFDNFSFMQKLQENDRKTLIALEKEKSFFDLVQEWLERLPFLQFENYDFWNEYNNRVTKMLETEENIINSNTTLSETEKSKSLAQIEVTKNTFKALFDRRSIQNNAGRRLSNKATLAALFILVYRDQAMLQIPFQFIQTIIDIDEVLTTWRHRHALLAQRMLGTKIGTGGSSGNEYLKATTEANRIFKDFMDLSTYLIPRSEIPELPEKIKSLMNFKTI